MNPTPTPADAKKHVDSAQASLNEMAESSTPPADAGPTEAEKVLLNHLQEELDPNCGGTTARALRFVRSHVASCLAEHALAAQPAVREFYERRLAKKETLIGVYQAQYVHKTELGAMQSERDRLERNKEHLSARLASLEAENERLHKAGTDTWGELRTQIHQLQADNERLRLVRMGSDSYLAGVITDAIIRQLGGLDEWPASRRQVLLHCIERAIWDASPPPSPSAGAETTKPTQQGAPSNETLHKT